MSKLDKSKKYSEVRGNPRTYHGIHYCQDDKYFGPDGSERDIETGELIGEKPAPEEKAKEDQFDFDTSMVVDVPSFDVFAEALGQVNAATGKAALKAFALEVVGMDKLPANRKLKSMIETVRAEFKSVLEAGIE